MAKTTITKTTTTKQKPDITFAGPACASIAILPLICLGFTRLPNPLWIVVQLLFTLIFFYAAYDDASITNVKVTTWTDADGAVIKREETRT